MTSRGAKSGEDTVPCQLFASSAHDVVHMWTQMHVHGRSLWRSEENFSILLYQPSLGSLEMGFHTEPESSLAGLATPLSTLHSTGVAEVTRPHPELYLSTGG